MEIHFLGAAQQVTGSCYFVKAGGLRLLVDCGLYQERPFLERNWAPFPMPPESIDFVLLTHTHLDHSGLLPKLVREGYRHPILMTPATADLLPIVLMDAAELQEEDAAYKKKRHQKEGRRPRHPEIPLYRVKDAEKVTRLIQPVPYNKNAALGPAASVRFHEAGHILGSAAVELIVHPGKKAFRMVFSGDLGQWDKALLRDPALLERAQSVVMESTYGDRDHEDPSDIETRLSQLIKETVQGGGNILIPVFAVERAQELMFHLSRLVHKNLIPSLPVFLDSPMATDVTDVFLRHPECLDRETLDLFRSGQSPFQFPGLEYVRSQEESKAVNNLRTPHIVMAGSGMCTGGRIKHHLVNNIGRAESTLLFVGYQAEGTLGRQIIERPSQVRIFGQHRPLRARVEQIQSFSGHADRSALMRWLGHFRPPPSTLFLTHGEKEVIHSLAESLHRERKLEAVVPAYRDVHTL